MNNSELNKLFIAQNFTLKIELSHTLIYTHNSLNILLTKFKEDAVIDVEKSIETVDNLKPLFKDSVDNFGITYPTVGSGMTEKARKYWAEEPFIQGNTKALAVTYAQLAHRMTVSMYIKFNKPKTPINVFKSIEKACAWLEERGA